MGDNGCTPHSAQGGLREGKMEEDASAAAARLQQQGAPAAPLRAALQPQGS